MSRSNWKGPYIKESLIKVVNNKKIKKKKEIQIMLRETVIIPFFVGRIFSVHNGKTFLKVKIVDDMIGHKLGEFSPTRKQFTYKKKKKK
uniref:ribosomal protein S19 n=1 Tax=Odontella aurita TaxID=265563 RepID=UPI00202862E3|nr:ribosomal protein S19 [Odontella aurita]QYB22956.1 ribosomal protein S19 [Odontella aurita]